MWTNMTTLATMVYNGNGFTVAPEYLAALIPPLAGERAGSRACGAHRR